MRIKLPVLDFRGLIFGLGQGALGGLLVASALLLSACTADPASPAPIGLNPTEFLKTRVPQVLTENAATLTAQPPSVGSEAAPTLTAPAASPTEPSQTPPASTTTPAFTATPASSATPALTATPSQTPRPTLTMAPTETFAPSATSTKTPTPRPTLVLSGFPTPPPALGGESHFYFTRPIGSGGNVFVASTYRFGSTNGTLETHHGVDIGNARGTPIVAVAGGVIYYAGNDLSQTFGAHLDFYGNLVILQLAQPWQGHTVYALYGHMDQVQVQTGQSVNGGDLLGTVGATGVAFGPHLHLETRLDNPQDYTSVYNPELWLAPAAPAGTVVVRVVNEKKQYLPGVRVTMRCSDATNRYLDTYWDPDVQPDPLYGENAAMTDVAAGYCHLQAVIFGKTVEADATVPAGGITFVKLVGIKSP